MVLEITPKYRYNYEKLRDLGLPTIFDQPTPSHPFRNKAKKIYSYAWRGAAVALTTILSINAFAHTTFESGATEYESSARIASPFDIDFDHGILPRVSINRNDLAGYSQIDLGPAGNINFDTFDAPAVVTINPVIQRPSSDELSSFAQNPQGEIHRIYAPSAHDLEQNANDLKDTIEYSGLAGATFGIISLLAIDALRKKSVREQLTKNFLTPMFVVGLLGITMVHQVESTLDSGLQNPQFEGLVSLYPNIQERVNDTISNLDDVSAQAAGSMTAVLKLLESLEGIDYLGGETTTNVLYFANSECLPGVFSTLQDIIAQGVHADGIIIGGNTSVAGRDNPAERFCVNDIEGFNQEVLYTLGSADGPATRSLIREMNNTHPLDGQVQRIGDLRGIGSDFPQVPRSTSREDRLAQDADELLTELVYANGGHPFDIVVVDDIASAEKIIGKVSLILVASGEARFETRDGTLIVSSGDGGGGGLEAFLNGGTSAQFAHVLHFDKNTQRLIAITTIEFQVLEGELRLTVKSCAISEDNEALCPAA